MKIVIEIEDMWGGGVKVKSTPSAESMIKQTVSGKDTPAVGYAMMCLNVIRKVSKDMVRLPIDIPRRGR